MRFRKTLQTNLIGFFVSGVLDAEDNETGFFVIGLLVIGKKYHNDCYHKVVIGWPVIGKKYHNNFYHKIEFNF